MNSVKGIIVAVLVNTSAFTLAGESPTRPSTRISTSRPATVLAPLAFVDCEDREYAVFAAVIESKCGNAPPNGQAIEFKLTLCTLDARRGTVDPDLREGREEFHDELAMMLGHADRLQQRPRELDHLFREVNRKPGRVDVKKIKAKDVEIIPVEQKDYTSPQREVFPDKRGVNMFSRVAFSKDGKQACVSISTQIGQFGSGTIYLMRLDEKGWHIIESNLTWIT